jgi:hypothetical protein
MLHEGRDRLCVLIGICQPLKASFCCREGEVPSGAYEHVFLLVAAGLLHCSLPLSVPA